MFHRKLIVLAALAWTFGFGGSALATTYDLTGQPTVNTIDIGFGVPSGTFGLTGSIDITLSQDLGTTAEFSVNAYVLSIDIDTNGVFFEASDVIIETTPFVHIPAVEPTFSGDAQFPGPVTLTTDSASGTWNLQGRIGEYDAPGLFGGNSDILSLASGTFSGSFLNPTELLMTIGFTGQSQLGPFTLIDPFPPLTFAAAAIINVPGDFATIQAAIDAALSGTTEVVVASGTYNEVIDFLGKAIKTSAKRRAHRADATHEHRAFAESICELDTLEQALEAWGWQLIDSGDDTPWLECLGHALGDDRPLFDAMAPFVEAGSFIEMSGEDGTLWRWHFDGKQCEEQLGRVVFGESARVLITVRGGVADFVTDGNVKVALIDYDNEPDAKIPEGFGDLDSM